ncbi:hypothetical protein CHS0354_013382 [Potamilus streckersoni]|uniref:Uncharacterized protein n=1 Tax=Potamilus streckersoni TaxID=2493646 RepID=A0AAE0RW26_9BIVA|nr:hypothetical protein CHS0354_013382 [Potamilus streckersoni]
MVNVRRNILFHYKGDKLTVQNKQSHPFPAERTLSKTSSQCVNGTETEPVISDSLTDEYQYETLSSDAKQSGTYDALKYARRSKGYLKVEDHISADSNHHNRNRDETLQDSNVNGDYFILEKDSFWNNYSRRKRRPSTTYYTIDIANNGDGYPVSVTRAEPRIDSAQKVSSSDDKSVDDSGSHEYIILEAVQDTNKSQDTIDVST